MDRFDEGDTILPNPQADVDRMEEIAAESAAQARLVPGIAASELDISTPSNKCDSTLSAPCKPQGAPRTGVLHFEKGRVDAEPDSATSTEASGSLSPTVSESSCSSFGSTSGGTCGGKSAGAERRYEEDGEADNEQKTVGKGKGKQVMLHMQTSPQKSEPVSAQSTQYSNSIPWAKDPERPSQKSPIRFVDCIGRHYIWPWNKARLWKVSRHAELMHVRRVASFRAIKNSRVLVHH